MTKQTTYRKPAKPTPKPCRKCGRMTLTGLDAPAAALVVTIDADVLTRDAELIYIVTGVAMYATNVRGEILQQCPGQVLKRRDNLDMHRVHDCDQVTPEALIKPTPLKRSKQPKPISEEVPF